MEKFEITDDNIRNALIIGKKLAPIIESGAVNKTDVLLFTALTKLYLENSFTNFGNDVKEFNEMFAHCEATARNLYEATFGIID